MDFVQVNTSEENNPAADLLEILENPNADMKEIPVFQLQDSEKDEKDERLEKLEFPRLDAQESGILVENSTSLEGASNASLSDKNEGTDRNVSSVRNARHVSNVCIKKYIYRIIYNYLFRIPICKPSCKPKVKTVSFANGKTLAIQYDCY